MIESPGERIIISKHRFTDNDTFTDFLKEATSMPFVAARGNSDSKPAIYFEDCVFDGVDFAHCSDERASIHWFDLFMHYCFKKCKFNSVTMTFAARSNSAFFINCNGSINFVACGCGRLMFSGGYLNVCFDECDISTLIIEHGTEQTKTIIDKFTNSRIGLTWVPKNKSAYVVSLPSDFTPRCPESGAFTAYKKGFYISSKPEEVIITLEIPEDAKRTSGLSNKCRCNKAVVKAITGTRNGASYNSAVSAFAKAPGENLLYRVGETVIPDSFDEEGLLTCSHGIHFFMTRKEAENYCY